MANVLQLGPSTFNGAVFKVWLLIIELKDLFGLNEDIIKSPLKVALMTPQVRYNWDKLKIGKIR